jgi:hypothetical protein
MAWLHIFSGSLFGGLQLATAAGGPAWSGRPVDIARGPGAFHNTGGPRSRTRRERITTSVFPRRGRTRSLLGARRVGDVWGIDTPGGSWRRYVLELLAKLGFADPDEAFAQTDGIPQVRLHCRPAPNDDGRVYVKVRSRADRIDCLRKALVLGKCCRGLYDPERPVIWTEQRLRQCYELHEIGASFYDDEP